MKNPAFYLGLALLFTHELDSMPNHEWRVLPFLGSLSDATGEMMFLIAHIPISSILIYGAAFCGAIYFVADWLERKQGT